ncbi:RNA polymerase sigma factor [Kitasatospora sp. NPDC101447]|uniref:RNA polymerase sigma factor n=1 Tax=Kitasatospora sp. NPDC101447 TaxID=3364102 RepID=UPI0037F2861A
MTAAQAADLESALPDAALLEDDRARARRRQADAGLVRYFRAHGFAGPRFESYAEKLMQYGVQVMGSWTFSGEIFRLAKASGRPVPANKIVTGWCRDERQQVSEESAVAGFVLFKERGLVRGTWKPDGGASLTTYYMNAVIRVFPQVYGRWHREWVQGQALRASLAPADQDEEIAGIPDQRAVDPHQAAATRDELQRILPAVTDPQMREIIAWLSLGYTHEEVAQRVGLPSAKAVERRLSRARRHWRDMVRTLELGEGGVR